MSVPRMRVSVEDTAVPVTEDAARPPAEGHESDGGVTSRSIALRWAWPAIALYAGLRAFGVVFLWVLADEQGRRLIDVLSKFDAGFYTQIATNGYNQVIPLKANGELAPSNLAFFPLYPGLIAAVDPVLPGNARVAGVAVSWLAGLAAAWALYAIGAHLRDRRTGILLAALWAVLPHAVVQSMGYTETLFTALSAWSLYALLRRHWVTAGLLCIAAGLTRPTGAALIATVGLAALIAVARRQDGWRPWVGGALAPLGLLGYITWVGLRLDRADGYFHVQNDAWKMSYDLGGFTLGTWHTALIKPQPLAVYATTLVLLTAMALLALLVGARVPWPLVVFPAVVLTLAFFGDSYYATKARLLLPAFSLLLPVALALAAAKRSTSIVVVSALAVISAGYGTYLCLAWTSSP